MKWFVWLQRRVMCIPPPRVTRSEALEIARQECQRRGWSWDKPYVVEEPRRWLIWIGTMRPPLLVVVDQQTGKVESGRLPR